MKGLEFPRASDCDVGHGPRGRRSLMREALIQIGADRLL